MKSKIVWLTAIVLTCFGTGTVVGELVAYYPLNEGSGDIAADVTGNGHDATAENGSPTWVNGQVGYGSALQWDGTNPPTGWMNCGTWNPSEETGELSVALWAYWEGDAAEDGWQGLIGKRQGWTDDGSTMMWCIEIDRDSNVCQFFRGGSYPGGGVVLPVGEWTHVAVSFDGTTAIFYINGEPTSGGGAFSLGPMTDATIAFGCVGGEGWNCFNGILDEVRIYDHGLSQAEIQIAMLPGAGPKSATSPKPDNGTDNVPQDVVLSWTEGQYADTHDVYFGKSFDDVSAADKSNPLGVLASSEQRATSYDPEGLLEFSQTYYWRVDEVNAPPDTSIHAGEVWSFTVESFAYPITNISATASSENATNMAADNTVNGLGLNGDLHSTEPLEMWLSHVMGDQPTWIEFAFDQAYDLHELWVWNQNQLLEPVVGFGIKDATIEHSLNGTDWTTLGDVEIPRAPGLPDNPPDIKIDLSGINAQYVRLTAHSNWAGLVPQFGLSEVRFYFVPVNASDPAPAVRDSGVPLDVTLDWRGGREAVSHEVYLSKNEDEVIDGTALVATVDMTNYQPGTLEYGQVYYWKVNEVNNDAVVPVREGEVWQFSTVENLIIDDFESYTDNDPAGEAIWQTWIDGFENPQNGSQVGYLVPPYAETSMVNSGRQSMPFFYNNNQGTARFSETERTFAQPQNWTTGGVSQFSLWYRGYSGSVGSFVEGPAGTFTMTGSGADITGPADEFHYAYKTLTGPGSIVAKIESIDNTHNWAKAGVMIRETLDPESRHAMAFVTPANGVVYEYRIDTGGNNVGAASQQTGITAPHWVKLERSIAGVFTASHSSDGVNWQPLGTNTSANIQMGSTVYIGLALTSHDASATGGAAISGVTTTGNISGQWINQDIGIATNDPEPLYMGLADSAGRTGIIVNEDPAAAQASDWTVWAVDLAAFADQGVDIGAVKKIILGAGDRAATAPGGAGTLYFDDIAIGNPVPAGGPATSEPVIYDFETDAQGWGGLKDGTNPTVVAETHADGGSQSLRVTIDEANHAQQEGGWASPRDFTADEAAGGLDTLSFWYRADDPDLNGGNFVFHWIMSTENWSGGGWYGNGLWGVLIADGQWHQQTADLSILGEAAGGWQGTWGDQAAWEFRDDLRYSFEIAVSPTDNTNGSDIYIDDVQLLGTPAAPNNTVVYDFESGAQGWGDLKRGTAVTVVDDGGNVLRATIDEAAHAQTQGGMQSGRDFTVDDVDISRGGFTTMSFRYRADDPDFNGGNFVFHWIMSTETWTGGGWYGNGLWGVVIADGQWHQQTLDLSILGEAAGGWQGTWGDQAAWDFRDDLLYNFELMFEPADSTTTGSNVFIDDVVFE